MSLGENMKLLDKIKSAKSKRDLDLLTVEIIMDGKNLTENRIAFAAKAKELEGKNEDSKSNF